MDQVFLNIVKKYWVYHYYYYKNMPLYSFLKTLLSLHSTVWKERHVKFLAFISLCFISVYLMLYKYKCRRHFHGAMCPTITCSLHNPCSGAAQTPRCNRCPIKSASWQIVKSVMQWIVYLSFSSSNAGMPRSRSCNVAATI